MLTTQVLNINGEPILNHDGSLLIRELAGDVIPPTAFKDSVTEKQRESAATKFIDDDGNLYELRPYDKPQHPENAACHGCSFVNNKYNCIKAPSCTPTDRNTDNFLLQGRHVWVLVKHWMD